MKTEWDYTKLASAYLKRPDYSDAAIDAMLSIAGAKKKDRFCDIGAGAAHLTLLLAAREVDVVAVEPNDSMRAYGIERTKTIQMLNGMKVLEKIPVKMIQTLIWLLLEVHLMYA